MHIGDIATVLVDGNLITGTVYHVRENGWPCVQTEAGRMASGPIAPVNFWEHVTYWQGTKRRPDCSNCGGSPMGEGCYHICPNSVHYYSPEQERADEPFYGDDDNHERYAATIEPSQYIEDDDLGVESANEALSTELFTMTDPLTDMSDDIPF